jgi:hypothetical protein
MLVTGDHESAYELAWRQANPSGDRGDAVRRWALEVQGEAAAATGRIAQALVLYADAATIGEAPFATRLAYAELLFAAAQYQDVLDLLAGDGARVAAQVHMLASAQALGQEPAPGLEATLAARFASPTPTEAEALSFRDRAFYELHCVGDAATALLFSQANWERQKGYEDFELVQAAARAVGDDAVLQELDAWRAATRGMLR